MLVEQNPKHYAQMRSSDLGYRVVLLSESARARDRIRNSESPENLVDCRRGDSITMLIAHTWKYLAIFEFVICVAGGIAIWELSNRLRESEEMTDTIASELSNLMVSEWYVDCLFKKKGD